jgi:hypothetical protein
MVMFSVWSREAISGMTPPYFDEWRFEWTRHWTKAGCLDDGHPGFVAAGFDAENDRFAHNDFTMK